MIIANFGINNYKSPIISSSSKDFDRKPLKKHHVGSASASEDGCSMLLAAERLLTGVKIADSECYFDINSQSAINTRNEKLRSESFPQHDVLNISKANLQSCSPPIMSPILVAIVSLLHLQFLKEVVIYANRLSMPKIDT
jgi:hypothetical protein